MLKNLNFYNFMHKQILVLIALFSTTAFSYVIIGIVYSSYFIEVSWYLLVLVMSYWGYRLYSTYSESEYTIKQKEAWLSKVRYFVFFYFSTWTIMFVIYVSRDNVDLHYLALFTQLGVSVVATTILVSEKRLAILILISSMLPITIYLILVGEFYSYVIAALTLVLAWVLYYGSRNTYNYLKRNHAQAYKDYLTKLGNRRHFIDLLEDAIKIQKNSNRYMFLILIDLDHFKTINDALGHDIGDKLLVEVSQRMQKLTKLNNGHISRLGGDEFCILSSELKTIDECRRSAEKFAHELLGAIKETYIIEDHHLYISASIGVSIIDKPTVTASTLIKEADIAMYEAKAKGRDSVILFNDELSVRVERKLDIERLLHFAIENKEISLMYQPQLNSKAEVIGCEVLARWNSEQLGAISPDEFIPICENTGIIIELGYYILEEAFKTLREWDSMGIELEQFSINISMRQIFHTTFTDDVLRLCKRHLSGDLSSKIIFEMTETSVAEEMNIIIAKMHRLKECGIRFSMDDFGTGYSSLSYLRQIPIDELKIDKSFIFELSASSQSKNLVRTIVNIAKNLNLKIVAEGVESELQNEFLLRENCDIFQGYYFSKPLSKSGFEEYLAANLKK
ncbi:MAG: bifunctional diguanylate cyclase/phosphodiesterase [Sulfurimonas sp.]|uniref:putative bifunctional diguanylate cyclase/phosphodiesterase n=1 Tax=Sulfurimonas sp. TaxID=2022749 RepID=UPI0025F691AE|nr:bifunctional diguanylate cyclase/phosphodiesterase [Sulfurimonas sp.]MCK9454907.1 bifunctional diguanylate cyclase/phosphodiesterase [Sulfurimonas sp.]